MEAKYGENMAKKHCEKRVYIAIRMSLCRGHVKSQPTRMVVEKEQCLSSSVQADIIKY
jgi:hypothetical protein